MEKLNIVLSDEIQHARFERLHLCEGDLFKMIGGNGNICGKLAIYNYYVYNEMPLYNAGFPNANSEEIEGLLAGLKPLWY